MKKGAVNQLKAMDVGEEYASFPLPLRKLVENLVRNANKRDNQKETKTKYKLLMSLSCLARARAQSYSPFDLALSLVLYNVTGSPFVLDLLARFGVGVCPSTHRNQSAALAANNPPNLKLLEGSDVVVWFDNIQKKTNSSRCSVSQRNLSKSYYVSLVTNIAAFTLSSTLQFHPSEDYSPERWNEKATTINSFFLNQTQVSLLNGFVKRLISPLLEEARDVAELLQAKKNREESRKTSIV